MTRPPSRPAEEKTWIVVSILRGEITIAATARREGVSQTSIAKWRDRFLGGGQAALTAGNRQGGSSREKRLVSRSRLRWRLVRRCGSRSKRSGSGRRSRCGCSGTRPGE